MDEIQASFLSIKLKYLKQESLKRKKIANFYLKNIKNPKLKLPFIPKNINPVWHLFVIMTKHRNKLIKYLKIENFKAINKDSKLSGKTIMFT